MDKMETKVQELTPETLPPASDNTTATDRPVADDDRETIAAVFARRVREVGYLMCQMFGSDRHSGR